MSKPANSMLLASLGRRLLRFRLDAAGVLHYHDDLALPSPLHYAWPHPSQRLMVVGCSARWFTPNDTDHMLVVVEVPEHGEMRLRGQPVRLSSRPIHVTLDEAGTHVLALFNDPPGVQVHALTAEGLVGAEIPQRADLDVGTFAHQVRVFPGGRWVLVAARGNDARAGRAEDPGSLRRFAFRQGRLDPVQVVAPNGGFGFGPRHVDFHPALPCIYVALERQNELHVYRHRDGVIEDQPAQVVSTLAPGKRPAFKQYAGAVHVHPLGTQVYVTNRDDPHAGAEASHLTGDNTLVMFDLDPVSGALGPPRHVETGAFHVRTFTLQPPWLIAASQADAVIQDAQGTRQVPASLGVFHIEPDGGLRFAHRAEVPSGGSMLFWCGFPTAYGSRWQ